MPYTCVKWTVKTGSGLWQMNKPNHLLSTASLTRRDVERLIARAETLRDTPRGEARLHRAGYVVASLFYEPSTRTRLSFESAAMRLGANVITAENALEHSSAKKGETLQDVFRVVGAYANAIVLRHHESQTVHTAARLSPVPVINAGAGAGEHPTQALLDVYTLWRELGRVDGLRICVMGDLKYGRTVHSLLRLLALFDNVQVTLLAPPTLRLEESFLNSLRETGLCLREGIDMKSTFPDADAVYQTRIQKERLLSSAEANGANALVIGTAEMKWLPSHARLLHPLPRVDEIHPDVDTDERAAYFRQTENGLYMRMAILDEILGGNSVCESA